MTSVPDQPGGPRVLYITRRYPPSVGGMETLARAVDLALHESSDPTVVALGRSQRNLPWFLPYAALRVLGAARNPSTSRVIFGDALTYATIRPLLTKRSLPATVMVHGLDMTFGLRAYRAMVQSSLSKADRVVANSRSTANIAIALGVDPARCVVLNPGLEVPQLRFADRADARARILDRYGLPEGTVVLATLGRLVKRKGVRWFVTEVMPSLPSEIALLVAGTGPEADSIRGAIAARGLQGRVVLLGEVDDETRALLFEGSDAFVMPNVPVPGDVEGFGLVAIEAAMSGALVIASRLEGITDAVTDDETGYLCEPADPAAWRERILAVVADLPAARRAGATFSATARVRSSLERMAAELPKAFGFDGSY